ncbi:MAG TPA: DUF5667 domain-containing protein, partial [Roseiflexaceae bacterium]|nr:DUF5667 domain-containing protein [Roseiflexaceae bacterium]
MARYPEYADVLEPLLHVSAELHAAADVTLPVEMEAWLAVGAQEFAVLAERNLVPEAVPSADRGRLPRRTSRAEDLATMLDSALNRTKRGESIGMVLAHYDRHADELEPLLRTAATVRDIAATPLPPEMEAWLATTGVHEFSVLAEQATVRIRKRRPVARTLTLQRAAAATLVAAVLLGTIDTVSAQSLPGEPLYEWKLAHEDLSAALTINSSERSKIQLSYAEKRKVEVRTLVEQGVPGNDERVTSTLAALAQHLGAAVAEASQAKEAKAIEITVKQISSEAEHIIAQASQSSSSDSTPSQATDQTTQNTLAEVQDTLNDVQEKLATSVAAESVTVASNPTAVQPSPTPTAQPVAAGTGNVSPSATQPANATVGSNIIAEVGSTTTAASPEPSLPTGTRTVVPTNTFVPTLPPVAPTTVAPVVPAPTNTPVPTNASEPVVPTRVLPTLAPPEPSLPTQGPAAPTDLPTSTPAATATPLPEPSAPVEPPTLPTKTSRPTSTPVPTATAVPPTATATSEPPTATSEQPTATPVTPTIPPTNTPLPPTSAPTQKPTDVPATDTPTNTPT